MRRTNIFMTVLMFLFISAVCVGQEFVEDDENWLLDLGGSYTNYYRITYQFKTFTKEDVGRAKQKLKGIREAAPKNEWEGVYYSNTAIGDRRMIWNVQGGFLDYYFYHELKYLDYGKITDSDGRVELVSEKASALNPDKKKPKSESKFVKVKLGEKHYLVPENRLRDFCALAVGLNTGSDDNNYYWTKNDDMRKKIFGLPILPKEYAAFIRNPIAAKITRVGGRKIVKSKFDSRFSKIHYTVTLNAGRNKNIKSGMNFFVKDLGEWIQIEKVFPNSAIGFIRRDFDENKQEECRDSEGGSGDIIPCKKISIGMKAQTKASENYF